MSLAVQHHAVLLAIIICVICIAALVAFLLKKPQKKIEMLSETDSQRIGERLQTGDISRSESRFRRRYGLPPKESSPPEPPGGSGDAPEDAT